MLLGLVQSGFDAMRLGSEVVLHTRTPVGWLDLSEILSRVFKGVEPPAIAPVIVHMHGENPGSV